MVHTLLCGQRRYTMPFVVVPTGTSNYDSDNQVKAAVPLKLGNIRPPSGLVLSARQYITASGIPTTTRALFRTEHGSVRIAISDRPTLYLSDGIIQSVEYEVVLLGTLDFFQYWIVQDVSYLAEVQANTF